MTDETTLEYKQRRERFQHMLAQLKERYEVLFSEPVEPRLLGWISRRIDEERDRAIKEALSHLSTEDLLELRRHVPDPEPNVILPKKKVLA